MFKDFLFWAGAFAIPTILFALNISVRINRDDRLISSGGDWLLSLIALDLAMLWTGSDFQPFISRADLAQDFTKICVLLLIFSILFWHLVVSKGEPTLKQHPPRKKITDPKVKSKVKNAYVLCWAAVIFLTFLHLLPFVWKA